MSGGDEPEEVFCGVGIEGVIAEFVEVEDVVLFVAPESFGIGSVDE